MGLAPRGGTCLRDFVAWSVISWTRAPEVSMAVEGRLLTMNGIGEWDGAEDFCGGSRKLGAVEATLADDAGTLEEGFDGGRAELAWIDEAVEDMRARRRESLEPFLLHPWPEKRRLDLDLDLVALVALVVSVTDAGAGAGSSGVESSEEMRSIISASDIVYASS